MTKALGGADGLPIDDEDTFKSEGGHFLIQLREN